MTFRLYDSAWVQVEGTAEPVPVRRNRINPGVFDVGGFIYDIDARPVSGQTPGPVISAILSIQAVGEAGLYRHYEPDFEAKGKFR